MRALVGKDKTGMYNVQKLRKPSISPKHNAPKSFNQVRDAVVASLQEWADKVCSPETITKYLPLALSVESPAGREDAVKWAAVYLASVDRAVAGQLDLVACLTAVVESLEHRVAEVMTLQAACMIRK
jgi:hypothetical protein